MCPGKIKLCCWKTIRKAKRVALTCSSVISLSVQKELAKSTIICQLIAINDGRYELLEIKQNVLENDVFYACAIIIWWKSYFIIFILQDGKRTKWEINFETKNVSVIKA